MNFLSTRDLSYRQLYAIVLLIVIFTFSEVRAGVWISGSNLTNQSGVYGTKGTADPGNVPEGRTGSVSWIDADGNLWLFGGSSIYGELNDLWKFDGTNWTWVSGSNTKNQVGVYGTKGTAASGNIPGGRHGSISWIDSDGSLWLFGGYGYAASATSAYLNDLWKFDGTNWTWVSGSNAVNQAGVYGTKGVADAGNVPGARQECVSWIDSSNNLWLFGGTDSSGDWNDLWKFNGTYWIWVSGSNTRNQVGVYGTKGTPAAGNVPGARDSGISWTDAGGNFWLFGGYGNASVSALGYLNDLWKFDGTNWTWVSGSNVRNQTGTYGTKGVAASANIPGGRYGSVSWTDTGGNLWLFGGYGYTTFPTSGFLNDLWKFDGTNWTWGSGSNVLNTPGAYGIKGMAALSNVPGARCPGVSWTDADGNLWLFGGSGYNVNGVYGFGMNDLWRFDACGEKPVGDLNGDCNVDLADFIMMAAHWLEQTSGGTVG